LRYILKNIRGSVLTGILILLVLAAVVSLFFASGARAVQVKRVYNGTIVMDTDDSIATAELTPPVSNM